MHFLLGLLGFAGICYLVGIIFFNKEQDPAIKFRKGLITTLVLLVGIGVTIFFVYQYNEKKENETVLQSQSKKQLIFDNNVDNQSPKAEVRIFNVEQTTKDSITGLEISVGGEFRNLKSSPVYFAIWFYFGEKGKYDNSYSILKDFNNKYATTDGQVTIQTDDISISQNGFIDDTSIPKLFIPLSELHLQKNYDDINQARYSELDKIKRNNRIALKAGVFQGDKSLDEMEGFKIYVIQ